MGAQRIQHDLAFSTYERSIGKWASFALKFGFIAEKFAQAYGGKRKGGNFDAFSDFKVQSRFKRPMCCLLSEIMARSHRTGGLQ